MADLSRWLNRINALLLAAWLGMVAAHGLDRPGVPAGRAPRSIEALWSAAWEALSLRGRGWEGGFFGHGSHLDMPAASPGRGSAGVEPAAGGAPQGKGAHDKGGPPGAGGAGAGLPGGGDVARPAEGVPPREGNPAGRPGDAAAASVPGAALAAIPAGSRWSPPLAEVATLTSLFGPRDGRWHHGVDLAAPQGTPVRAVWAGVVRQAGWRGEYGLAVEVAHPGGWSTLYGHLSSLAVEPGQRVARGQVLGRLGATGNATGPHLHLEVRAGESFYDPLAWLDRRWYRPAPALRDRLEAGGTADGAGWGGS